MKTEWAVHTEASVIQGLQNSFYNNSKTEVGVRAGRIERVVNAFGNRSLLETAKQLAQQQ